MRPPSRPPAPVTRKKPGGAALGANHLNFHHIFCLHLPRLLYRLASCQSPISGLWTRAYELAGLFHPSGTLLHGGALRELFAPTDRYRLFAKLVYPPLAAARSALEKCYCADNGRVALEPVS